MDYKKLLQLCDVLGVIKQLSNRGYISVVGDEVIFNDKSEKLLKDYNSNITKVDSNSIESWIEDFVNLFPKGVRTGGYLVKSDKISCLKKMEQFTKLYPYSKEIILEATRNYINRKELEGYKYMKLAKYFILHDKSSELAAECEFIVDNNTNSNISTNTFEEEM